MTNKEAIKILSNMIHDNKAVYGDKPKSSIEALDLAIKALEDRPQGEWIFRCQGYYKCNICGEVERAEKNFCPDCGADMRGTKE